MKNLLSPLVLTLIFTGLAACNPLASDPSTSSRFLGGAGQSAPALGTFSVTTTPMYKAARIKWTDSTGVTSYTIKRGTSVGSYPTTLSTNAKSPYLDLWLTNGTNYHYMVTANGASGQEREADAEAIATPAVTNAWITTSATNAPEYRNDNLQIATDEYTFIWGGEISGTPVNTGAVFNSEADTWTTISATNAPTARIRAKGVWTGTQFIVWGGEDPTATNTGGVYDLASDTWTAISTTGAPSARSGHTAVWTGSKMIIWGGSSDYTAPNAVNTGAAYDPATDTWTPIAVPGVLGRYTHVAVYEAGKMNVIDGVDTTSAQAQSHLLYDVATNTWSNPSIVDGPTWGGGGRYEIYALGNGKIFVWKRGTFAAYGGVYDLQADSWTKISLIGAGNTYNAATYGAGVLFVWDGGATGTFYDIAADTWNPTPATTLTDRLYIYIARVGTGFYVFSGLDLSSNPTTDAGYYKP